MECHSNGGTNKKILLFWLVRPEPWMKENKFSTVTVEEIIDFYFYGTALLSKATNTIVFLFGSGRKRSKSVLDNWYSRDTSLTQIGNSKFPLEIIGIPILTFPTNLDSKKLK